MLTVQPIRYVSDVVASRRFYESLGLRFDAAQSAPVWALLHAGSGDLGLHDAAASQGRSATTTELAFSTDEKLEELAQRLTTSGHDWTIVDENFGRSLRVVDPDGVVIQIQEIDVVESRRNSP